MQIVVVQYDHQLTMSNSSILSSTVHFFPPQEVERTKPSMELGRRQTPEEAEPRQHPNCVAGARHAERSLVPQRDAERRPENWMGKQTERADGGQARTPRQDGATHVKQVKAPLQLRERVQTKRTSAARPQRRDAEQTWLNA